MQLTLLELVQDILSSMDSDEVDSITETTEAMQVARIVRQCYFNIIARADLPEHKELFQLTGTGSATEPVQMVKPTDAATVEWIKYNVEPSTDTTDNYQYVTILPVQQFMDLIHQFDIDETNVLSMTLNDITYYYKDDKAPEWCTFIDDNNIIFDSYDADVDTTALQTSKSLAYGIVVPTFTLADATVPDLDEQQFPLLLNEAKSLAFAELKQMPHEKAEKEARRQWVTLQRTKRVPEMRDFDALPNFGRTC